MRPPQPRGSGVVVIVRDGRVIFTNFSSLDLNGRSSELFIPSESIVSTATDKTTPKTITVVEAARLLDVDRNTLYEMLRRGEGPPARRCGTTYRLDRDALGEWLRMGDRPRGRR